jgi:signal transduction histidine kinase
MDEAHRLSTLINDVLDLSKLEKEVEQLNISNFNLTRSISETTQRMEEMLKNEGFEIRFQYDGSVYVNADEIKIGRAFYNLLINAVNFSGNSRTVIVTQTITEGCVKVSVTDEGEGVAEDEIPFIWNRYYKSGKKHKRAVTGTGLGLSIVKKILEMHGGEYGVTSEIGKGSTFWFEIELETAPGIDG